MLKKIWCKIWGHDIDEYFPARAINGLGHEIECMAGMCKRCRKYIMHRDV